MVRMRMVLCMQVMVVCMCDIHPATSRMYLPITDIHAQYYGAISYKSCWSIPSIYRALFCCHFCNSKLMFYSSRIIHANMMPCYSTCYAKYSTTFLAYMIARFAPPYWTHMELDGTAPDSFSHSTYKICCIELTRAKWRGIIYQRKISIRLCTSKDKLYYLHTMRAHNEFIWNFSETISFETGLHIDLVGDHLLYN